MRFASWSFEIPPKSAGLDQVNTEYLKNLGIFFKCLDDLFRPTIIKFDILSIHSDGTGHIYKRFKETVLEEINISESNGFRYDALTKEILSILNDKRKQYGDFYMGRIYYEGMSHLSIIEKAEIKDIWHVSFPPYFSKGRGMRGIFECQTIPGFEDERTHKVWPFTFYLYTYSNLWRDGFEFDLEKDINLSRLKVALQCIQNEFGIETYGYSDVIDEKDVTKYGFKWSA